MNAQNNVHWFGKNPMLIYGVPLHDGVVSMCGVP